MMDWFQKMLKSAKMMHHFTGYVLYYMWSYVSTQTKRVQEAHVSNLSQELPLRQTFRGGVITQ